MITPELIAFIRAQRASGVSNEEIKASLLTQKWDELDITAGFSMAEVPAEVQNSPVITPSQPMVQSGLGTDSTPARQSDAETTASILEGRRKKGHGWSILRIAGGVLAVIIFLGPMVVLPSLKSAREKGQHAIERLEFGNLRANLEIHAIGNNDLYPDSLSTLTENPDAYDYAVSEDNKTYRLCIKGKTDADSCADSPSIPATENMCESEIDPVTAKEMEELVFMSDEIKRLTDEVIASPVEDSFNTDEYTEIDALQKKLELNTAASMRRQIASSSVARISAIVDKYCGSTVVVNPVTPLSTEEEQLLQEQLVEEPFGVQTCKLETDTYNDSEIPHALNVFGHRFILAGRFDEGIALYQCSAEKYYNPQSMYRLAQVYYFGSKEMEGFVPNTTVKTEILQDRKRSYFWMVALLDMFELREKEGGTSLMTWNMIALLDQLQQDQTLTDKDLLTIEEEANAFVAKKYPEILEKETSAYAHSMRSMVSELVGEDTEEQQAAAPKQVDGGAYYDEVNGISLVIPSGWTGNSYKEDSSGVLVLSPINSDSGLNIKVVNHFSYGSLEDLVKKYRSARTELRTTKVVDEQKIPIGGQPAVGLRYLYTYERWGDTRTTEYIVDNVDVGMLYVFDINGGVEDVEKYMEDYMELLQSVKFIPRKHEDFSPETMSTYKKFYSGVYHSTYNNSNFYFTVPFDWMPGATYVSKDDGSFNAESARKGVIISAVSPEKHSSNSPVLSIGINVYPVKQGTTMDGFIKEVRNVYTKSFASNMQGTMTEKKRIIGGESWHSLDFVVGSNPDSQTHYAVYFVIHNGLEYTLSLHGPESVWALQENAHSLLLDGFKFAD